MEGGHSGPGLSAGCRIAAIAILAKTFVVMPHPYLPHIAQAVWGGNPKDVQAVAVKGPVPIQMSVATPAVCSI